MPDPPVLYILMILAPYRMYHLLTLACSYLASPLRKNLSLYAEIRDMVTAQDAHLYAESSLSSGCLTVTQLKWVWAAMPQKLGLRFLGRHF